MLTLSQLSAISVVLCFFLLWRIKNEHYGGDGWGITIKKEILIDPSIYLTVFFTWGLGVLYIFMMICPPEHALIRRREFRMALIDEKHKLKRTGYDILIFLRGAKEPERKEFENKIDAPALRRVEVFENGVDATAEHSRAFAFAVLLFSILGGSAAKTFADDKKEREEKRDIASISYLIDVDKDDSPFNFGYTDFRILTPKGWVLDLQMFNNTPGPDEFEALFGKAVVNKKTFKFTPMSLVSARSTGEVLVGANMRVMAKGKKVKFFAPFIRPMFEVNGKGRELLVMWFLDYPLTDSIRLGFGNLNKLVHGKKPTIKLGPSLNITIIKDEWGLLLFPFYNCRSEIPGFQLMFVRTF